MTTAHITIEVPGNTSMWFDVDCPIDYAVIEGSLARLCAGLLDSAAYQAALMAEARGC